MPASITGRMVAFTRYLRSNGFSANAAAGAVGNAMQESSLNPGNPGGGLFANLGNMWAQQISFDQSHSLDPTSATGQLAYAAWWAKQQSWFAQFNSARTPQDAALWWQNGYEQCAGAGARGTDQVGGGPCNPAHRQTFAATAAHAGGGSSASSSFVSNTTTASCVGNASVVSGTHSGRDPIPAPPWQQSRDDAGIDACAKPGDPIYAPVDSRLVLVFPNWYNGQPLMLLKFAQHQAGTPFGDQYWYVAEQITPTTTRPATLFHAGSVVARFASSGTCIEMGWGSPSGGSWTLAGNHGDPGALHPSAGATTTWAESFKRYFGFPKSWIGTSP